MCESCGREDVETKEYILDDFDLHALCEDCWIIVYGEGRYS